MSMYGKGTARPVVDCSGDPGLTRQSEKDQADINKLMARYEKTGVLPPMREGGVFGLDVSEVPDYREAVDMVRRADEFFMQYPAAVRSEFRNDPAVFLDFVMDPANAKRAEELGIFPKGDTPEPPPLSDGGAGGGA